MSYLRSPFYVWGDGFYVHIWQVEGDHEYSEYVQDCDFPAGVAMPNDVFDAICLFRVAEIEETHNRRQYEERALKRYGGNFGSAALYRRLAETPPWLDPSKKRSGKW